MNFKRTLSSCSSCPLSERNRIWGEGRQTGNIIIVGEAPGEEEDSKKKPFVGASGSFLNWGLGASGILRFQSWVTNTISCRPPSNQIDSLEGTKALNSCREGFLEELAFLLQGGEEKVVLALGRTAIRAFEVEGKIEKIRGSVFQRVLYKGEKRFLLREPGIKMAPGIEEVGKFVVIPTFHPAALLRMRYKKGDSRVNFKHVWIADLKKAKNISENGWNPPKEEFNLEPTVRDFELFLDKVEKEGKYLSIDIETTGLNRDYAKIVVIGFASDSFNAISIPLLKEKGEPYWKNGDRAKIQALLNRAFSFPLAFQNALFDTLMIRYHGYNLDLGNIVHDTMILHHSISPELPHKLGFIVSIYGDTPYWKDTFLEREGGILEMNQLEMRRYNLRDCVVIPQVIPNLLKDLKEGNLEETYYKEALPLIKPVGKMMENGILIDLEVQKKVKRKYKTIADKMRNKLYSSAGLPEEFNIDSDDELRYFLFGIEPSKFKDIDSLEDFEPRDEEAYRCSSCGKKFWTLKEETPLRCPICLKEDFSSMGETRSKAKRKKGTKVHQDILNLKKIKDGVHQMVQLPNYSGIATDSGKVSVSKEGLLSFQIALQNQLERIEKYLRPKPEHLKMKEDILKVLDWIGDYREWKEAHKLENDFTNYKPGLDGRVHGSYFIHGTATGRLSMKDPNLMQVPKRAKDIRKMFIAPPGSFLLSGDYRNLEVFVLAYETGEPELLPVIRGEINQHDENTKALFGIDEEDPNWSYARDGAKAFQFGRIQYGGTSRGIYKKVILKAPKLVLTYPKYQAAERRYFEKYKVLAAWQEEAKRKAREERISETFLGRKRILMGDIHDIEKQGLNTPIQGGAAGVINRVMPSLEEEIEKRNLKAKIVLQVHDQLIYEVPNEERKEMIPLMKKEMEREFDFYGKKVHFPVDLEEGPSWGDLKPVPEEDLK